MRELTGIERVGNILRHQPVDRVAVFEHFWEETVWQWTAQDHLRQDEDLTEHFGFDMHSCGFPLVFNYLADLDKEQEIVEETEDTVLARDGNGALLRWHKKQTGTPEHIDFLVKERKQWLEYAKPNLKAERRRINVEQYKKHKLCAARNKQFFVWSGLNVFELMHPLCGHEHLLTGMITDPDWVKDMVETYARLNIDLMEILFSEAGQPDGIWFYEDMGFKEHPFFSPAMYKEIIQPGHRQTIEYAKSRKLPVIMHSCGFVEPLIPGLIEAGIDCLQVIEIKAGMDLLKLYKQYGDRIALMGGMDIRVLGTNEKSKIDAELSSKMPVLLNNYSYILHSDHSIPPAVEYSTYCHFLQRGLELGKYTGLS